MLSLAPAVMTSYCCGYGDSEVDTQVLDIKSIRLCGFQSAEPAVDVSGERRS